MILGCRLDDVDVDTATHTILKFAEERAGAQIVTLGTEMVVYAQRDDLFRALVNRCALSLCDTVGLLAAARLRGAALRERVTGVELIDHLCAAAAEAGVSVYLFGGAPGVAQGAATKLRSRYPLLGIAGTRGGYFSTDDAPAIADDIARTGAGLLFVGLGSPRQEFWIERYLSRTQCGVAVGVGGSFDVISGNVARAPEAWRRLNLEWLYRLLREPHRWRRQLALPYFVWLVALDGLKSCAR